MRDSDFHVLRAWQAMYKHDNNAQWFIKSKTSCNVFNNSWTGCLLNMRNLSFWGGQTLVGVSLGVMSDNLHNKFNGTFCLILCLLDYIHISVLNHFLGVNV